MRKTLFYLTIIIFIFTCSFFVNRGTDYGQEISLIDSKILMLKSENEYLESIIAERSSCKEIFKEAKKREFINAIAKIREEPIALVR